MQVEVSERAFEDAIEACLLQNSEGLISEERGTYLDFDARRLPEANVGRL